MRGYGPIGQQLAMARGPMRLNDDMVYPGGGDMGMEMSEPYEQNIPESPLGQEPMPARAMPVHDTGQMQSEYKRMGMRPGEPIQNMTQAFQGQPSGPIKEQLHSAQHQMMLNDQNTVNQTKRMELGSKKQMIQQKIMALTRAGRLKDAAALQKQMDMLLNSLETGSGALPE